MSRVIIVDDSAFMVSTIKAILESAKYTVVGTANCGEDAVDLCKDLRPDLVMMDILMPGTGGLVALEKNKRRQSRNQSNNGHRFRSGVKNGVSQRKRRQCICS